MGKFDDIWVLNLKQMAEKVFQIQGTIEQAIILNPNTKKRKTTVNRMSFEIMAIIGLMCSIVDLRIEF